MRAIHVFFEDGDHFVTSINGTDRQIVQYYLGNLFNLGSVTDRVVRCVAIILL